MFRITLYLEDMTWADLRAYVAINRSLSGDEKVGIQVGDTDGMVHDYDLDVVAIGLTKVPQRVAALVREGAWEERDDGWFIAGWFRWNESTKSLQDKRKRQQEGAAKTNHKRHVDNGHPFVGSCAVCLGEVDAA